MDNYSVHASVIEEVKQRMKIWNLFTRILNALRSTWKDTKLLLES